MGPTNLALVKLYKADQELREAERRLDAASKGVRVQERRVNDLAERIRLAEVTLKEYQSRSGVLELDIKSRDARIEKLRQQQQTARTNKEYQAFLIEINTEKVDRGKAEEETLKVMEAVEKEQGELAELRNQHQNEQAKLATMKQQIGDTVARLQGEIDRLRPVRDEVAAQVPAQAREAFERLAERYEGEAMAAIARPDRRREEYVCTTCNMDLVADIYNKLLTRDDLVFCPSCRRILYIPENLPPDLAVNKRKPRAANQVGASSGE